MVRKVAVALLLAGGVIASTAGPVRAFPLILDYTGFAWTTPAGGPPRTFAAVGVLDGFSESVADPVETYTFCMTGFRLAQVIPFTPSIKEYVYSGGTFGIYRSTGPENRGYDYGTNPGTGSVEGSFTDGVPWLFGSASALSYVYNSDLLLGTLDAHGSFTSGEFLGSLLDQDWSTFAGMTARPGSGIPQGYAYRLDGQETAALRPVPEPASAVLLGLGLAGVAIVRRRRKGA